MFATRLRRTVTVLTTLFATLLATATSASADVPIGWAEDTQVAFWDFLVVLVLIPGGLTLLLLAACLAFIRKSDSN